VEARRAEGLSELLLNTSIAALLHAGYLVSASLTLGLPPPPACFNRSLVEFASGLPCRRTIPRFTILPW